MLEFFIDHIFVHCGGPVLKKNGRFLNGNKNEESNQENQDSCGNQKNVNQGQRPDMEKGYTQQRNIK